MQQMSYNIIHVTNFVEIAYVSNDKKSLILIIDFLRHWSSHLEELKKN
jgi:hypothetical protein